MGYLCPVCEDPQSDATHLANHLAFTAMLGDDDHEDWLDEHAPGWGELNPPELADRIVDHADETDYPQVFEDTTEDAGVDHEQNHDHDAGRPHGEIGDALDGVPGDVADVDDVFSVAASDRGPADALAEARELTRERRANAAGDGNGDRAGEGDTGQDDEDDAEENRPDESG